MPTFRVTVIEKIEKIYEIEAADQGEAQQQAYYLSVQGVKPDEADSKHENEDCVEECP
tara:strand:+ start:248 stop:421 length:174 start_codon:yes stop_codon:yes gene_type:complete